jgi:hypothetical protein
MQIFCLILQQKVHAYSCQDASKGFVTWQLFASVAVTFVCVRSRLATLFITYNWPWHDVTMRLSRFYSYFKNVQIIVGEWSGLKYITTVSSVQWHVYCCSTHSPVTAIECPHTMYTRYRRLWACNNSVVGHVSSISRPPLPLSSHSNSSLAAQCRAGDKF